MFGYGNGPKTIPAHKKQSTRLFKSGHLRRLIYDLRRERPELTVNRDIAAEVLQRMGWNLDDATLLATVAEKVKDVRKVMNAIGAGELRLV